MNLNINKEDVKEARLLAKNIAEQTQEFIELHTTSTVERAVCRLLGIDGVDKFGVPLPNVVVDHIIKYGDLSLGVSNYLASAINETNLDLNAIAKEISEGQLNIAEFPTLDKFTVKSLLSKYVNEHLSKVKKNRQVREDYYDTFGKKQGPELYVIVATGNIYEDVTQALAAANNGADIVAVIRTTGQSLLDFVPYGATTEGFGGTYATQENFRIMRKALDEVGEKLGRYIKLVNYASGLCMPEISAMGALERLDMMLNDSLYGILFRDINMQRTFVDQYFSRVINSYSGVIINTGEDNYLTTSDAFTEAHTVLASQFINEQFAKLAFMPEELMGLGHAYEIDPKIKNSFVYELAQAQLARQIFPKAPLKYMPPTKHMTGDIFKGHIQNALFNMTTIMTNQKIHLLGMLTEAVHTPFMMDRSLSIENAKYIFQAMENFGDEIEFKEDGMINKRANYVLDKAKNMLQEISEVGIFKTLEKGDFAGIKRGFEAGKGLNGVYKKSPDYINVVLDEMIKELTGGAK
ncbi:D-lysine 5,6-aminomutase subunit alpha [Candidatus Izimaplasma bacterium ZiA1]|uniref:lysine 5,6-aminomutase subunit alpha n=1 Tax=Candidatus Izimoplasma sp. ZiA1 TaxID=2024899 RepID=UPI000BAA5AF1|nr:D-lysine 5,6-aminomutase subunit alpha [Candidatus Izimaplasma bacterium ZiA1]